MSTATIAAHADWSTDPRKRWMAVARRHGPAWHLAAPEPVGELATLSARLLARAGGGAVSRRQIVEALRQDWATYDLRRIDTLVSRLRARWQRKTGRELPLRTLHREGYEFAAMVEEG